MPAKWTPETLKTHLDNGDSVFLKLWQKGCGPCRLSSPAIERLETANKHGLVFGQICADDFPDVMQMAGAEALPAFFVFKDKKMVGKYFGFKGIAKLEAFIDEALAGAK